MPTMVAKYFTISQFGGYINDVMQVGIDTLYVGVGKTPFLAWQRGKRGYFESKLCDVIYEYPLSESGPLFNNPKTKD